MDNQIFWQFRHSVIIRANSIPTARPLYIQNSPRHSFYGKLRPPQFDFRPDSFIKILISNPDFLSDNFNTVQSLQNDLDKIFFLKIFIQCKPLKSAYFNWVSIANSALLCAFIIGLILTNNYKPVLVMRLAWLTAWFLFWDHPLSTFVHTSFHTLFYALCYW